MHVLARLGAACFLCLCAPAASVPLGPPGCARYRVFMNDDTIAANYTAPWLSSTARTCTPRTHTHPLERCVWAWHVGGRVMLSPADMAASVEVPAAWAAAIGMYRMCRNP